jgi:hypothetical protein
MKSSTEACGQAITTHGSLDLKQEILIQIQTEALHFLTSANCYVPQLVLARLTLTKKANSRFVKPTVIRLQGSQFRSGLHNVCMVQHSEFSFTRATV